MLEGLTALELTDTKRQEASGIKQHSPSSDLGTVGGLGSGGGRGSLF